MTEPGRAIPVLSLVGRSGVGKTTLLEKLIPELKQRGYRVATIKHHAHPGFEMDRPGKDTWRHARAGSDQVILAGPDKVASIRRVEREPTLDELAGTITGVDIILTEGYKGENRPKIELVRAARGLDLTCSPEALLAVASDATLPLEIPRFDLNDVAGLVDLIESRLLALSGAK